MDQATQLALDSIVERYAADQVVKERLNAEDAFLYGRFGQEFLGLQNYREASAQLNYRWNQPGNVGNDPGQIGTGKPSATYTYAAGDASSGDAAVLTAKGPANAWANIYFYMKLPTPVALPRRLVDSRTFLIQDLSGWQALEWQSQITMNGLTYNMAWQANLNSKRWRYFDYTKTQWIEILPSNIFPFPDFTKPVTLAAEFALDGQSTTHVALTINGTKYHVGIKQAATVIADKSAAKFTSAVQIDPKPGGSCSLQISQHDVRYI